MLNAGLGRYTFEVDRSCGKLQIAKEVGRQFNVKVVNIKTTTLKGKAKRTGSKRNKVEKKPWKKAIVQLEKDQKIDLFEVAKG